MKASSNEVDHEVQDIMKAFADAGIEIVDFPSAHARGQLLSCDYAGKLTFTGLASCEWHVRNEDEYCIKCLDLRLRKLSPLRSVLRRSKKKRVSTHEFGEGVSQLSLVLGTRG